jgi:hypothetical protein
LGDVLNFFKAGASFFFLKLDEFLPLILRLIKFFAKFYSGYLANPPFDYVFMFDELKLLYILLQLLRLLFFMNEIGLLKPFSKFYPSFEPFLNFQSYILSELIDWGLLASFLIFYVLLMLLNMGTFY